MILRDALVLTAREGRQISSVLLGDELGDIMPAVVPRLRDGTRMRQRVDRQRRRLSREALVDEDVSVCRMIDDEQSDVIDEVGFPELRRNADVVDTVARDQLI